MNLFKFKDASTRFFMASPCKADLTIKKTMCSCEVGNRDYIMHSELNDFIQPIRPDSIDLEKGKESIVKISYFDRESKSDQKKLIEKCVTPNYAGSFFEKCADSVAKDPEAYNEFLKFTYEWVYVKAVGFLKDFGAPEDGNLDEELRKEISKYIEESSEKAQAYGLKSFANKVHKRYKTSRNFQSFYVASGAARTGSLSNFYFAPLFIGDYSKDSIFTTKRPLTFEEFRIKFEAILADRNNDIPVKEVYLDINAVKKEFKAKQIFNNLLDEDEFLGIAARDAFFNHYFVRGDEIDTSKIIKTCDSTDLTKKKSDNVWDINQIDYDTARVSVPCFNIDATLDQSYKGYNFCYSGDHSQIELAKFGFMFTALAIDITAGLTIGSIPVVGWAAETGVLALTGAGSEFAAQKLDEKKYWPRHGGD
jgi:hypothetical protein